MGWFSPDAGERRNAIVCCDTCEYRWEQPEALMYHFGFRRWILTDDFPCPNCNKRNVSLISG